jgi:hypothetical protein
MKHYGGARAMVSRCVVNPLGRILLRNDTSGSKNKTGQQAFKGAAARFARAEHNLEPRSDINLSTKYPNKQLHGGGPDHIKNISRSLCLLTGAIKFPCKSGEFLSVGGAAVSFFDSKVIAYTKTNSALFN